MAVTVWGFCGGLDWNAIPIACEVFGIEDVEALVHQLVAIRDRQREINNNG